jgi:hypothetical protein
VKVSSPLTASNSNANLRESGSSHAHPLGQVNSLNTPPLRLQRGGDVGVDGIGLASTTYFTSSGVKYTFLHGRPVGFAGAEEIISCLNDVGMRGNLYRLVRSKLESIGEEEAEAADANGDLEHSKRHADALSESEAKEREEGMDLVACSVTARRHPQDKSQETALQEQYVVALLGTDTILDTSAIAPSQRRPRPAAATTTTAAASSAKTDTTERHPRKNASSASDTSRLGSTQGPLPHGSSSSSSTSGGADSPHQEKSKDNNAGFDLEFEEDQDYQLHPQEHYSALPAQRKAGAAVPIALCPPSRTLRVPVKYSAVEDRLLAPLGMAGDKGNSWKGKVMPQRMFRLATSETRTWAFYNDSEYVMHVYTLFDRASRLEPRDSTRLWPSSVFDEGNEAPTPPPVFFGLFFDEEGEEAVPNSEMPDSIVHRPQCVFGTRGMWIAELLVPPRSTRLFVEGKVRGAYRMRCTRLELDDLVAATATALSVAKKRNARLVSERFHFGFRRPGRRSSMAKAPPTTAEGPAKHPFTASNAVGEDRKAGAAAAASSALDRTSRSTPPLVPPSPLADGPHPKGSEATPAAVTNHNTNNSASLRGAGASSAAERSAPGIGCHSTLTESRGVLTRQTYIRNVVVPLTNSAAATLQAAHSCASHRVLHDGAAAADAGGAVVRYPRSRLTPPPPLPSVVSGSAKAAASSSSPIRGVAVAAGAGAGVNLRMLPPSEEGGKGDAGTGPATVKASAAAASTPGGGGHQATPPIATSNRMASLQAHTGSMHDAKGATLDQPASKLSTTSARPKLRYSHLSTTNGDCVAREGEEGGVCEAAGDVPHPSLLLSSTVQRNADSTDDVGEEEMDSILDTERSCVEFAKVRPDRQRRTSLRGEVLFSDSGTPSRQEGTTGYRRGSATTRSSASTGVPLLAQEALPLLTAHPTAGPAAGGEGGGEQQRTTFIRMSHISPRAPEDLSPRARRKRLSHVSVTSGVAGSLDGVEDKHLSLESAGTLCTTLWQSKVHTLTPRSSYQSERLRRTEMPSISSCRTVAVDDSVETLNVEGCVQEEEAEGTAPPQREADLLHHDNDR